MIWEVLRVLEENTTWAIRTCHYRSCRHHHSYCRSHQKGHVGIIWLTQQESLWLLCITSKKLDRTPNLGENWRELAATTTVTAIVGIIIEPANTNARLWFCYGTQCPVHLLFVGVTSLCYYGCPKEQASCRLELLVFNIATHANVSRYLLKESVCFCLK